jgi:integrase/recombinase XerD
MPRGSRIMLPFASWPTEDKNRWEAAFAAGDRFDGGGSGAHLAAATRKGYQESYGRFLGFLSAKHADLMACTPEARIDQSILAEYISWRGVSCSQGSMAIDLDHLRGALRLLCPRTDWSWLLKIIRKLAATAPRYSQKHHLVTSDRLFALGINLMDRAIADAEVDKCPLSSHALQYRDGLMISILAAIPLRSRSFAALRIGHHLKKTGELWELEIPATETKSQQPLEYPIADELSKRIDLFLDRFRDQIPGAKNHIALWPSIAERPMTADAIYVAIYRQTKKAFGFGVNLHRFRHAAASFWSTNDPANVQGVRDLLGHASFTTTERHYVMAQSRVAGRALARALGNVKKGRWFLNSIS